MLWSRVVPELARNPEGRLLQSFRMNSLCPLERSQGAAKALVGFAHNACQLRILADDAEGRDSPSTRRSLQLSGPGVFGRLLVPTKADA
jgi:hypothetical protein